MNVKRLYRSRRPWLVMLAVLLGSPVCAFADATRQQVAVALPALYALTSALATGTSLDVVRLPEDGAVPMESQANALSRLDAGIYQKSVAVVTLGSLWRADPLYAIARRQNLRIVEIDASHSWDSVKPGVAVSRVPANDVPWAMASDVDAGFSPFAWLGPVNAMRMSSIIAADLARLAPADAPRITANLKAQEGRLRTLKASYGNRLIAVTDLRVMSLASEFTYLFGEFGVFVDGSFVRQDIDWTDADRSALTQYLRERDIHVVVHKWAPDAKIVKAIEDGGARLLILDPGNPGLLADASKSYEALLSANLDALLAAFNTPGSTTSGDQKPTAK